MPALHGTANFKRLFISGPPEDGWTSKALSRVNARRFSPTTASQTVAFGWVPMADPLADKLTEADLHAGELFCVGFRMDERVVRAADVRDELKLRIREVELGEERRLNRKEKAVLKQAVLAELRANAPVRRRVAELVWNPEKQEARLFGASKPMLNACAELFEKTFSLSMEEANVEGVLRSLGWKVTRPDLAAARTSGGRHVSA